MNIQPNGALLPNVVDTGNVLVSPIRPMEYDFDNSFEMMNQVDRLYGYGNQLSPNTPYGRKYIADKMAFAFEAYMGQVKHEYNREIENIKHSHNMELEFQKANDRKMLEEHKAMLREQQFKGIEKRKDDKLNSTTQVFMNEDGELVTITILPDGKVAGKARRLLNVKHIQMSYVKPKNYYLDGFAIITWDGIENQLKLPINQDAINNMAKEFNKRGVNVNCGKNNKKDFLELIWSYLIKTSVKIEKVAFTGWNYTDAGWEFQNESQDTFEALIGGNKYE